MYSAAQALVAIVGVSSSFAFAADPPTAETLNGTYFGVHSDQYDQDFFLGVGYAQPPVDDLRFRVPQSLNTTWAGEKNATAYPQECYGYGGGYAYDFSEDCLYLNIVRPSGYEDQQLPVGLWIHGGALSNGGTDQRFNLSFIVHGSVEIGKPFIGISINYRLSAWGFIAGNEVQAAGQTNLGLRDQRIALQWVQENIEGFGGDPTKVTIWGESAGAASVGMHLVAYGGRDDSLYRAAIMESGSPVFSRPLNDTSQWQSRYDLLTQKVGCSDAADSLQCLREVPTDQLNQAINSTTVLSLSGTFSIDGDIILGKTSLQVKTGSFVHVPIISGTTADEGTFFSPLAVTSTTVFYNDLINSALFPISPALATEMLEAYPDDPAVGIPGTDELPPDYRPGLPYGQQWRRSCAYWGDAVIFANRRLTCEAWASEGVPVYSFRFNANPAGYAQEIGITHFTEVAFVFDDVLGVGYPPVATPPFQGKGPEYTQLADLMSRDWASFISDLDPNAWRAANPTDGALWPQYSLESPQNYVFDANVTSYVEKDTFRAEGIQLINDNAVSEYSR